jgi:AcrR family transcriptional regulator
VSREERILDAAERLIVHYGYDKTTVAEIASQAGVSKGAIYLHFESKEALMEALLLRAMGQYGAAWIGAVEADPRGGTFGGMYRNVLKAVHESPLIEAMLSQDPRVLGSYMRSPDSLLRRAQMRSMRTEFIVAMQEAGCVHKRYRPEVVAHLLDMLGYGLMGVGEVKPREQIPPLGETLELIGEVLDRTFTPDGADSEAGKLVLREMMAEGQERMKELVGRQRSGEEES